MESKSFSALFFAYVLPVNFCSFGKLQNIPVLIVHNQLAYDQNREFDGVAVYFWLCGLLQGGFFWSLSGLWILDFIRVEWLIIMKCGNSRLPLCRQRWRMEKVEEAYSHSMFLLETASKTGLNNSPFVIGFVFSLRLSGF